MNDQLVDGIKRILADGVGVNLFFVMRDDHSIKRVDIENGETQTEIEEVFRKKLEADYLNTDIEVLDLSKADSRNDVIYKYDFDEFPEKLQFYKEFEYNIEYDLFSFSEDDLSNLDALLIVVGNQNDYCVLYKKFYPVMYIGRGGLCLIRSKTRFRKLEEEVLRINADYQYIIVDGEMYILKLETLEKFADFHNVIEKEAVVTVNTIEDLGILEEPEILNEMIADDISFARKLCKIGRTSPIITKKISGAELIRFSKTQPGLNDKFKYNDTGNQIVLTSNASKRAFLKMLDDSYLISELTNSYYDSSAKDLVQ